MRFKDKVVLVTGASRGIGSAIALAFAEEGAKVIINYLRSEKQANEVLSKVNAVSEGIVIQCDVCDEQQVKQMIDKAVTTFGRIDILVNNAGSYVDDSEWDGTFQAWDETFKQNLFSIMLTSKYTTHLFQKQNSGVIINIASRYALRGRPDALAYASAKAGVVSVTEAYAQLLAPFGRANAVSPGATNAGYWLRAPKDELEETIAASPMKKLIDPKDIAKTVLFLASDEASMISGQNILVDGGK